MRKKLGNRKFASEPAKASCTTYGLCTEPQRPIVCFVLLPRLEKQRALRPSRESDLWILSLQVEWHQPRSICGAWLSRVLIVKAKASNIPSPCIVLQNYIIWGLPVQMACVEKKKIPYHRHRVPSQTLLQASPRRPTLLPEC